MEQFPKSIFQYCFKQDQKYGLNPQIGNGMIISKYTLAKSTSNAGYTFLGIPVMDNRSSTESLMSYYHSYAQSATERRSSSSRSKSTRERYL